MALKTKEAKLQATATANGNGKKATTSDRLTALIATFQKIASNPELQKKAFTQPMHTEKLPQPLKDAVLKIQEIAEVPLEEQSYWLKCVFRRDKSFSGIKNPEIALVHGKPSLIIDNHVYDALPLLSSDFFQVAEKEGKNKAAETIWSYYGYITIKNSGLGTEALPITYWTEPSNRYESSMMCDEEYLVNNLYEYIFPLSTLDSGTYSIEEYGKNGKFFTCTIDNTLYYLTEEQVTKQLDVRKHEKKPLNIIVSEPIAIEKDGIKSTYKSTYVEGFARANSIKSFIADLNIQPGDEELKSKGLFLFETPITLDVKGITESQYKNKEGDTVKSKVVTVIYSNRQLNLIANSPIKKAIDTGTFNLKDGESLDGYQIHIRGVKFGNKGYEYQISFTVPSVNVEESMTDLFEDLGFNL
jgi:hypothetical protein